jgi:type IV pilus assembly protein PilB
MTQRLRKLILQNLGVQELKEAAVQDGMLTLRMDGLLKILKGITTVEQVVRETSS